MGMICGETWQFFHKANRQTQIIQQIVVAAFFQHNL